MFQQETEHTRNEREVLATVDHPFLIKLFHAFQSRSHLYFVMEFAHGGEIYTHLARCSSFPIRRCRFYGAEIVSAFGYLHSVCFDVAKYSIKLYYLRKILFIAI